MALTIKYKKSLIITLLYLAYMLSYSVMPHFVPEVYLQMFRNVMILTTFVMFFKFLSLKLNLLTFIFVLICMLSVIFNDTHPIFQAKIRYVFFLIIFFGLGLILKPKLSSDQLINFDQISRINTIVIILSFVSYFTYIGSLGRGNFSGVLNHSNTLGPIAALVCIDKILQLSRGEKKLKTFFLFLISFFVLILSGSRASLGTLLISLIFIGIYIYRIKFIVWGTGIGLVLISAFFVLKEYNHLLIPEESLKNRYRPRTVFEKGFDNTRFLLWEERIDEFLVSPLLGSGFSSVNISAIPKNSVSYDLESGSIQPGSGYLGILSMLGIFGFLAFVFLIFYAILKLYFKRNQYLEKNFLMVVSILLFILIHSVFEGYLISSGNILFLIFWIAISYIFNKQEINNENIISN